MDLLNVDTFGTYIIIEIECLIKLVYVVSSFLVLLCAITFWLSVLVMS